MRTTMKATLNYVTIIALMKNEKRQISSLLKINVTQPTNPNITSLLKQAVGETISQTSQPKEGTHIRMDSPQVATFAKALIIVIINAQTKTWMK